MDGAGSIPIVDEAEAAPIPAPIPIVDEAAPKL